MRDAYVAVLVAESTTLLAGRACSFTAEFTNVTVGTTWIGSSSVDDAPFVKSKSHIVSARRQGRGIRNAIGVQMMVK
jgi:hypothetical protein